MSPVRDRYFIDPLMPPLPTTRATHSSPRLPLAHSARPTETGITPKPHRVLAHSASFSPPCCLLSRSSSLALPRAFKGVERRSRPGCLRTSVDCSKDDDDDSDDCDEVETRAPGRVPGTRSVERACVGVPEIDENGLPLLRAYCRRISILSKPDPILRTLPTSRNHLLLLLDDR